MAGIRRVTLSKDDLTLPVFCVRHRLGEKRLWIEFGFWFPRRERNPRPEPAPPRLHYRQIGSATRASGLGSREPRWPTLGVAVLSVWPGACPAHGTIAEPTAHSQSGS